MTSGSKSLCRIPTSSPSEYCHCPFVAHALMAELCLTASGTTSLCGILRSIPSACCQCPPGSHALMAELLLITLGGKTLCAHPCEQSWRWLSWPTLLTSADGRIVVPAFRQQIMVSLPSKECECKLPWPTLLTSADARTVADDIRQQITSLQVLRVHPAIDHPANKR